MFEAIHLVVGPPLMGENIENGAALQELPDKSKKKKKRYKILLLKIEEKESKT